MKCKHCGRQFKPRTALNTSCSRRCSRKAWLARNILVEREKSRLRAQQKRDAAHATRPKITIIYYCAHCKSKFIANQLRQLYCGLACQKAARYRRENPIVEKFCLNCYAAIEYSPDSPGRRICSRRCAKERYLRSIRKTPKVVTATCYCGVHFTTTCDHQKYCSVSCRNNHNRNPAQERQWRIKNRALLAERNRTWRMRNNLRLRRLAQMRYADSPFRISRNMSAALGIPHDELKRLKVALAQLKRAAKEHA